MRSNEFEVVGGEVVRPADHETFTSHHHYADDLPDFLRNRGVVSQKGEAIKKAVRASKANIIPHSTISYQDMPRRFKTLNRFR